MTNNPHTLALEAAAKAIERTWHDSDESSAESWETNNLTPINRMIEAKAAIKAYLAALAQHGLKVTPREPTEEACESVTWRSSGWVQGRNYAAQTWRVMHDSFSWPTR